MNLDEQQKQTVSQWLAEGLKISDIQKRLLTGLGVSLTYMEVRLLVDDLKLLPKDPPAPPPAAVPALPGESPLAGAADSSAPSVPGQVSVSLDTVTRPGSVVSGNVTFSDGQSAVWSLDQFGRLGFGPKQPGYKPSPADMQAFQQQLEKELARMGL